MKDFKIGLSLRYKLLLMLSCLPMVCLGLYLLMATDLFKRDKVAYVFDSSVVVSRSVATQTRVDVEAIFDSLRPICESFDFARHEFSATSKMLFDRQKHVRALVFFQKTPNGTFAQLGSLVRDPAKDQAFVTNVTLLAQLQREVASQVSYITALKQFPGALGASFRAGDANDPKQSVMVALYESPDLTGNFEGGGLYQTYLLKKDGRIAVGPDDEMILTGGTSRLNSQVTEGTAEMKGSDGKTYLVSYAATGIGDLSVVSYIDKDKALKAVQVLVVKSLMFSIALIAFTLIISVIASGKLTATLSELFEATKKVAQGDFKIKVESRSRDEIGGLAQSFNWMAEEVSRLMSETAQKARMENELATVKTVQETLFPPGANKFGPVEISGHFEPASECGGDWWSYSKVNNKLFLWVGDATGHGAPAALITSAARSAAAVIETIPDITPSAGLKILNHAIHQTSKGKINMTFFLGCLDLTTGLLTYSNASHDPPYLMKKRAGQALKKKDLIPLMDVNGPRLGEKPTVDFPEASVQLEPGDLIFFYTDGILDIQNPKLEKWGERTFLKNLLEASNGDGSILAIMSRLQTAIGSYREKAELIDDVTMFMVEFNPAKEVSEAA